LKFFVVLEAWVMDIAASRYMQEGLERFVAFDRKDRRVSELKKNGVSPGFERKVSYLIERIVRLCR
jgi:hypothetical protein